MDTRMSEERSGQRFEGFERFLDGVESILHGVYRLVRWPFSGVWGCLRGILQWANILEKPEPPVSPTYLTIDFRGRWYTGTVLLNHFKIFRLFHSWLLSWYYLRSQRLVRWYGGSHRFEKFIFVGALDKNVADSLVARLIGLKSHRLPKYHFDKDGFPNFVSQAQLCHVRFEGDYSYDKAKGLLQSLYTKWLKHFPFDIQLHETGRLPVHSRWYSTRKIDRVDLLRLLYKVRVHGLMLNEREWLEKRFSIGSWRNISMSCSDVLALHDNEALLEEYFEKFSSFAQNFEKVKGEDYTSCRSLQAEDTYRSPDYGYFDKIVEQEPSELARVARNKYQWVVDEVRRRWMEAPTPSNVLSELRVAESDREQLVAQWEEAIAAETESAECTHPVGAWSFWQRLLGLTRLNVRTGDLQKEVIEHEDIVVRRSLWSSAVSGFESLLDVIDSHLYAVYSVLSWPFRMAYRGVCGALQYIGVLGEAHQAIPADSLTLDFRGRWYTGTSLLSHVSLFARFHSWLLSWYYLSEQRLVRWHGEAYRLAKVECLGVVDESMAEGVLQRLIKLKNSRLPGYHVPYGGQPALPDDSELCHVHFEGDFSFEAVTELVRGLEEKQWLLCFPITVNACERGRASERSHWHRAPKKSRVEFLQEMKRNYQNALMRNEWCWIRERLCFPYKDYMAIDAQDASEISENIGRFESYIRAFRLAVCQAGVHEILTDSEDKAPSYMFEKRFEEEIVQWRSVVLSDDAQDVVEEGSLMPMLEKGERIRQTAEQHWDALITSEQSGSEYEAAGSGLWGYIKRALGEPHLQVKASVEETGVDVLSQDGTDIVLVEDSAVSMGSGNASSAIQSHSMDFLKQQGAVERALYVFMMLKYHGMFGEKPPLLNVPNELIGRILFFLDAVPQVSASYGIIQHAGMVESHEALVDCYIDGIMRQGPLVSTEDSDSAAVRTRIFVENFSKLPLVMQFESYHEERHLGSSSGLVSLLRENIIRGLLQQYNHLIDFDAYLLRCHQDEVSEDYFGRGFIVNINEVLPLESWSYGKSVAYGLLRAILISRNLLAKDSQEIKRNCYSVIKAIKRSRFERNKYECDYFFPCGTESEDYVLLLRYLRAQLTLPEFLRAANYSFNFLSHRLYEFYFSVDSLLEIMGDEIDDYVLRFCQRVEGASSVYEVLDELGEQARSTAKRRSYVKTIDGVVVTHYVLLMLAIQTSENVVKERLERVAIGFFDCESESSIQILAQISTMMFASTEFITKISKFVTPKSAFCARALINCYLMAGERTRKSAEATLHHTMQTPSGCKLILDTIRMPIGGKDGRKERMRILEMHERHDYGGKLKYFYETLFESSSISRMDQLRVFLRNGIFPFFYNINGSTCAATWRACLKLPGTKIMLTTLGVSFLLTSVVLGLSLFKVLGTVAVGGLVVGAIANAGIAAASSLFSGAAVYGVYTGVQSACMPKLPHDPLEGVSSSEYIIKINNNSLFMKAI